MITVTDPAYGATGDGITDDAPAIQAALDQRGWVYVPAGTYALQSCLQILQGTRLTLDPDARLLRAGSSSIAANRLTGDTAGTYTGRGNIVIEGGTWDLQGQTHTTYANGLSIGHAHKVTITGVTFLNTPGFHAVEINSSRMVRIRDCEFAGFLNDPAGQGDRSFSEAIQVDGSYTENGSSFAPYDQTPCDDLIVTGCRFSASAELPAWPRAVGSHGYADLTVNHARIKVTDNTMDGPAVRAWHWDQSSITGNHFKAGSVTVQNSQYVTVTGNKIHDAPATGIWVNASSTQIVVRGNEVIGSSATTNNSDYGIRTSGGCSWVRLTGNVVRKRASGPAAKYGLSITSDCTSIQRYGNDLRSSGVSGSLQDGSTSAVTSATDAL